MHHISLLSKKKRDLPIQILPDFFSPRVWSFSTLPFGSSGLSHPLWPAVLSARHTSQRFTCSQHPAYTPPISPWEYDVPNWHSAAFPAMVSSKGLDEIPFCLDISLLWGCWSGSKQRLISDQSYIPVKDNHRYHQKAITNLILKKHTKPIYQVTSKNRHVCTLFPTPSGLFLVLFRLPTCWAATVLFHVHTSLTKRKSDSFYKCF